MDNNQLAVYLMQNITEPLTKKMNQNQRELSTKLNKLGDQLTGIENRLDKLENIDRPEEIIALSQAQLSSGDLETVDQAQLSSDDSEAVRYDKINKDVLDTMMQVLNNFPFSDPESMKSFIDYSSNTYGAPYLFSINIHRNNKDEFINDLVEFKDYLNSLENPKNSNKGEAANKISDRFMQVFNQYNKYN